MSVSNDRGFRPRQKGVACSVEGCDNWCVSNDLCPKHNMAMSRYGSTLGKPAVKKVCKGCGKVFEHKYDVTGYCRPECYRNTPKYKKKRYQAVKAWRRRNIKKSRERDSLGKRTRRRFPNPEICVIEECTITGERHHPDYEKPYEIVWLCKQHHKDADSGKG